MPPRKRMRWKQPAPNGSGQPPAKSSFVSTGDADSAVRTSIKLEGSDTAHLAAKLMDFKAAKDLHSDLLAMLDEPDDAIRLESRSSRERKHKGNLVNTFGSTKENCTRRHWRC